MKSLPHALVGGVAMAGLAVGLTACAASPFPKDEPPDPKMAPSTSSTQNTLTDPCDKFNLEEAKKLLGEGAKGESDMEPTDALPDNVFSCRYGNEETLITLLTKPTSLSLNGEWDITGSSVGLGAPSGNSESLRKGAKYRYINPDKMPDGSAGVSGLKKEKPSAGWVVFQNRDTVLKVVVVDTGKGKGTPDPQGVAEAVVRDFFN